MGLTFNVLHVEYYGVLDGYLSSTWIIIIILQGYPLYKLFSAYILIILGFQITRSSRIWVFSGFRHWVSFGFTGAWLVTGHGWFSFTAGCVKAVLPSQQLARPTLFIFINEVTRIHENPNHLLVFPSWVLLKAILSHVPSGTQTWQMLNPRKNGSLVR